MDRSQGVWGRPWIGEGGKDEFGLRFADLGNEEVANPTERKETDLGDQWYQGKHCQVYTLALAGWVGSRVWKEDSFGSLSQGQLLWREFHHLAADTQPILTPPHPR